MLTAVDKFYIRKLQPWAQLFHLLVTDPMSDPLYIDEYPSKINVVFIL